MIIEDYVSFETAKLLKEKGYKITPYNGYYNEAGICVDIPNSILAKEGYNYYPRPTQAVVMSWLRAEMNIFIDICTLSPIAYIYRVCLISDTTGSLYEDYACEEGERFMSYEEAVEFALSYVLENIL